MRLLRKSLVPVVLAIPFLLTACQRHYDEVETAIQTNNINLVQRLLAQGEGDSLTEDDKSILLCVACETDNPEMVRLVSEKLHPPITKDCVAYAVLYPSKSVLEVLFEYDKERTQTLASLYFSSLEDVDMASYLLSQGCSPVYHLHITEHLEVFKACVRAVEIKDISNDTIAITISNIIRGDDVERLAVLLNAGLDVDLPYIYEENTTIREYIRNASPSAHKCVIFLDEWEKKKQ